MDAATVIEVLKVLGADVGKNGGNDEWISTTCLFAQHTHKGGTDLHASAAISSGGQIFKCCSCGKEASGLKAMLYELYRLNTAAQLDVSAITAAVRLLDGVPASGQSPSVSFGKRDFIKRTEGGVVCYPKEFLASFPMALAYHEAIAYLKERRMSQSMIKTLDLRFDTVEKRICFPYYKGKDLIGIRGRAINPDHRIQHYDYAYRGQYNVGSEWFSAGKLQRSRSLIVVEGEFDFARVFKHYRNVVAMLGSTPNKKKMGKLSDFKKVIWFADSDGAGVASTAMAEEFFQARHTPFTSIPLPLGSDPDALGSMEMWGLLSSYVAVDDAIERATLFTN